MLRIRGNSRVSGSSSSSWHDRTLICICVWGIPYWFSTLSLAHRDFSRCSESSDGIMSCRWWYIHKCTLRNINLKLFHNLLTVFSRWVNLLRKSAFLGCFFLYHASELLPNVPLAVSFQYHLLLLLLPPSTFKLSKHFSRKTKMSQFKHLICLLYSILNTIGVYKSI